MLQRGAISILLLQTDAAYSLIMVSRPPARSVTQGALNAAADQDRRLRGRRGTLGTGAGSGVQPAMARAHSRALALSVMPGNSRRSSIAADNSPPCS